MTRERLMQKLWMRLTELQREYVRKKFRRLPTEDTERGMVRARLEIMRAEERAEKAKMRKAA